MPIEIRELIVRTRIGPEKDREERRPRTVKSGQPPESVREALEQLDEIMQRRKER